MISLELVYEFSFPKLGKYHHFVKWYLYGHTEIENQIIVFPGVYLHANMEALVSLSIQQLYTLMQCPGKIAFPQSSAVVQESELCRTL